jgi:death-on-curing protein
MKEPVWLDRADCLAIHDMVLSQHGGLAGVRDKGLLDSALGKPRNLLAYRTPALAELAAGYAAGIILNHPFFDGNKHTGFILASTFMELNGLKFIASEESVVENTLALAAGQSKEADYATWLKTNSEKTQKSFC